MWWISLFVNIRKVWLGQKLFSPSRLVSPSVKLADPETPLCCVAERRRWVREHFKKWRGTGSLSSIKLLLWLFPVIVFSVPSQFPYCSTIMWNPLSFFGSKVSWNISREKNWRRILRKPRQSGHKCFPLTGEMQWQVPDPVWEGQSAGTQSSLVAAFFLFERGRPKPGHPEGRHTHTLGKGGENWGQLLSVTWPPREKK